MITEIVTFKLPEGMTHDDVVANFGKTAPNWGANPDLIRKNYLVDANNGLAGYKWTPVFQTKGGSKWLSFSIRVPIRSRG